MTPTTPDREGTGEESAIAVCKVCGMPIKVVFVNGEIDQVLAPCGHVKMPEASA